MRHWHEPIIRLTLLVICWLSISCGTYTHISDEMLIRNFSNNEPAFIKLREMAASDTSFTLISPRLVTSSTYVAPGATKTDHGGMSKEKYAEYTELFKSLGLADGVLRNGQSVWFSAEARSWANGSVTKGYVYSTTELAPLVSDLDSYIPQPTPTSRRPGFLVFKIIKSNWYLYKRSDG
jgi:hypothetical protein